jgi:steroid delta-isomerase-like uncharacterized protein
MSAEANKAVIRRWWAAMNQGQGADVIDEVYAADYVLHDPTQPEPVVGTQGVHEFVAAVSAAFPDLHMIVEDLVAEGDRVVQRLTARGTHQGEFLGVPASGDAVTVWLIVISRIADGKVAEEWQLLDALGLMQQIGAIPAPGSAG